MNKRFIALILALAVLVSLCLTGCGKKTSTESGDESTDELSSKYAYLVEYTTLEYDGLQSVNTIVGTEDKIIMDAYVVTGSETYTDESTGETYDQDVTEEVILSMNLDGSNIEQLATYTPEGSTSDDSGTYIQNMTSASDGGFFMVEYAYDYQYDLPEDFDSSTDSKWNYQTGSSEKYYIHKFDSEGNQVSVTELPDVGAEYFGSVVVDGDGNVAATDWTNIYVISAEGKLVKTIEATNMGSLMYVDSVGIGATIYNDDWSESTFKTIDMTTGEFGDELKMGSDVYELVRGFGDYSYCYSYNGKIYGYNESTDTTEKIIDWLDYDVDYSNLQTVIIKDDGSIVTLTTDWTNDETKIELVTLTPTDPSNVVQKKELTLACMYLDWTVRSAIIDFNKQNNEYRIKVKDYSEYATDDDYYAGLTKLNTEIISGNVPDMIYTANIPISKYAGKGILEDLWPYIESDTRFGRDDMVESVFKAVEIDGKLYQTVSSFSVTTALGLTDVVGDKLGWTLDDLKAALNTLPEGAQVFNDTATKSDILNSMISMNMSTYIDWTTGECKFDTEDFISLLNFTAGFAEDDIWDDYDWNEYEDDYTRMKSGKQLLYRVYLYGFDSMSELQASLGKDVTFVGYPTDSGYGAAFSLNDGIAMTTSCSNKDVAWEFMGTFLTADYQQENSWSFCTNKEVFEQQAKDAMTQEYDSDGNPIPLYSYGRSGAGDTVTDVYAITQEMYEAVLEVINNTTMVSSYDQEIIDIITDETAAFFEGQKTAEETAKMLQSRISLYVGEQM